MVNLCGVTQWRSEDGAERSGRISGGGGGKNGDDKEDIRHITTSGRGKTRSVLMLDFLITLQYKPEELSKNCQICTQQQTCRFVLMLILLELFALFWTRKVHYKLLQRKLQNFDDGGVTHCYALLLLFFLLCTLLYFKIIVFSYSAIQPQVR